MELTATHLRYLLTIYDLSRSTPDVGAVGVAKALGVTKPSVTRMLGVLMEKGLLVRERYGKIYLTDTGFLLARNFTREIEELRSRIPAMRLELTEEELLELTYLLAASLPEHTMRALRAEERGPLEN